jgi:hypothetical protein
MLGYFAYGSVTYVTISNKEGTLGLVLSLRNSTRIA